MLNDMNKILFDTHAHYDDKRFDDDRDEILRSMPENGVGLIINPGCDIETSKKAIEYAEKYPHVYAAVGIHPECIEEIDIDKTIYELKILAKSSNRIKAIGEIGLDYYWVKEPELRAKQAELLRRQLSLAKELGMPVIIHDRDAHADTLKIVEEFPEVKGVFHCYSGSTEMANRLISLGYLISFTGVITYKNAKKAVDVVENIPLDKLMIETDAPYMSPEPFRGRRNSSLYVYRMAEAISDIKKIPLDEVINQTTENGKKLFGI